MGTKTFIYSKNPEEYNRVLDVLLKWTEIRLSTINNLSGVLTAFILGLVGSLVVISLPQLYIALLDFFTKSLRLFSNAVGLILSTAVVNIIVGSILILFLIGCILLLIFLFLKFPTFLSRCILSSKRFEKKLGEVTGLIAVRDILTLHDQLLLAKLNPEGWDLKVLIDETEKRIEPIEVIKRIS